MGRILLEVAVTSADESRVAEEAGADRLELCSALELSGVTPSPGTFLAVREAVAIPVYLLLRPRAGGFVYSSRDWESLKRDAEWFASHGADGLVFGALTADGCIDDSRCAELLALSKGRAVFHRAFDFVPDRLAALEVLIGLGFERVLTSGGAATALEGKAEIASLVRAARGRIEILPGSGIRPHNVEELLRETGCTQVHASLRNAVEGASGALARQMGQCSTTDALLVRAMREALDRFSNAMPRAV